MELTTCRFCLRTIYADDLCDIDGEAGCYDCKHLFLEQGSNGLRDFSVKVYKTTPGTEAYKAEQRRLAKNLRARVRRARKAHS